MKDFTIFCDKDLVLEIQAGNIHAFDVLYRRYGKKIFKFSYVILKSSEEAENILQIVFMNFWINRYKVEKAASVKSYLYRIAYNSSISVLRRKANEIRFIEYLKKIQKPYEDEPEVLVEDNQISEKLEKIIVNLPGRQKELFLLHNIDGLKYAEISKHLNISSNTIENHMSQALKTIRRKLGSIYNL